MKKLLVLVLLSCFAPRIQAQTLYFPPLTGPVWDTISPATLGWCPDKVDSLLQYLDERNTKAFLVLKGGKLVLEEYFGTFTRDSLWYWASAGKTLTGLLTGIAQQDGYLNITDTTSDYLGTGWTVCTPAQEARITIRNQLSMTSGLDDGVPDYHCTLDTCLQYLADAGTRWAYHNGPYTLLDGVIESATGTTLNQYLTLKVKTPTGMTGLFVPSGYNNLYISTARSMARFGLLLLNEGTWNTTPVLTDTAYFHQMVTSSQVYNQSYGYLTWLNGQSSYMVPGVQFQFPGSLCPAAPADMYAALGKNGQIINVVPSQQLVVVRMGNSPGTTTDITTFFNDTIWQKLNAAMCVPTAVAQVQPAKTVLHVYPNPAQQNVTFELVDTEFSIELTDYTGRVVLARQGCRNRVQLELNLPAGVYGVRAMTERQEVITERVVVVE